MLGERIKSYMDDHGIKYSHIAEKAHIPVPIFSAMLNEKRAIKAEEYFDICTALDVDKNVFANSVGEADEQEGA